MLQRFLEQLHRDLGLSESVNQGGDDSYSLHFEPDLQISLRENPDSGITLFTKVVPLPTEKSEEYMLKLLDANLFGRETGGAALGLDSEGKKITLVITLPADVNYKMFRDALGDFVNYADSWREETKQFMHGVGI